MFGDLVVLAIVVLPVLATFALLRAEPIRLDGLVGPATQ
jgi:hypothetical protein